MSEEGGAPARSGAEGRIRAGAAGARLRARLRRLDRRWPVLVLAVALALPPWGEWAAVILPSLSLYVALGAALAGRAIGLVILPAVAVLLPVMRRRRWLCRRICPLGLLQDMVARMSPANPARWRRVPNLGPWLLLLTLGGAFAGYPLFLWLDPLAIFQSALNSWRIPLVLAAVPAMLAVPLLLALEMAAPHAWCRRICPLGAVQDGIARVSARVRVRRASAAPDAGWMPARRGFLATVAGAAAGFALRRTAAADPPPLRPPGSLPEDRFTGVCVRCSNCSQACPARIIRPAWGEGGAAGLLAPILEFENGYCREDCRRCGIACPSGAIVRLPLAQKNRSVIGTAVVDLGTCLLAAGQECTACIRGCPYEAMIMHTSEDGFGTEPRVDAAKCNGCGACEQLCPVRPGRAVRVRHVQSVRPGGNLKELPVASGIRMVARTSAGRLSPGGGTSPRR